MKILIMYRLWSKCVPMNLKRTLWHLKLNWLTTLDPLASLLPSDAYFQLKWPYSVLFWPYRVPRTLTIPIKMTYRWFFLVHWNISLPKSKQNLKFSFFAFLEIPIGVGLYVESSDPLYRGVPVKWFQNFYHLWYCTIILHILRVGK